MNQWSPKSPQKEGVFWFAYENPDLHNRYGIEIREIKKDREGKFFNASGPSDWDWGPDPKYLAMSHMGMWLEIERPNDPYSGFGSASEDA